MARKRGPIKTRLVVEALRDGFPQEVSVKWNGPTATVTVEGYAEPITVHRERIDVPECFEPEVKAGIRLDLQAIHSR